MQRENIQHLLVIRADADGVIGSGHVMRCLALAQEWRRQGGEVVFWGRIGTESLRERIMAEGCRLRTLQASYPDPMDLVEVSDWLHEKKTQPGWLVLDGYHFDAVYHDAIRATGWSLLVIDDCAHLPEYQADILLNPNAYAEELPYKTKPDTLQLLGPRYAPLRREFFEVDKQCREVVGNGRRILVTMGGADPDNVSGRVVDAIWAMNRGDLEVKIVIGSLNPNHADLTARLAGKPFAAELQAPVTAMVPLMQWADLAVSAAGSTCLELAALGVPMVVTVLANNQELMAASLATHKVARNLGWFHDWQPTQAAAILQELLNDQEQCRQMGEKGRSLVDGKGCGRVIAMMHSWRGDVCEYKK